MQAKEPSEAMRQQTRRRPAGSTTTTAGSSCACSGRCCKSRQPSGPDVPNDACSASGCTRLRLRLRLVSLCLCPQGRCSGSQQLALPSALLQKITGSGCCSSKSRWRQLGKTGEICRWWRAARRSCANATTGPSCGGLPLHRLHLPRHLLHVHLHLQLLHLHVRAHETRQAR